MKVGNPSFPPFSKGGVGGFESYYQGIITKLINKIIHLCKKLFVAKIFIDKL